MDLMWSVVALTVATFTVLLAARRILMVGSALVFSRYVAVGGLVAFTVTRDGEVYRVRFEVGGPGVFHNVTVQLFGADGVAPPAVRHTMAAGDAPIEWTFALADITQAWVMVTWVRPYLQGVESEALAQRLAGGRLYEWRWYSETSRYVRTVLRFLARRWAWESLRELPLYGRWRRTSSNSEADLLGPAATAPPRS
ncbi:hypothetical protein H7J08_19400 [Mycobacterium frederiksbergense]|uniref:Uncharacterized protein n=1 Tax=Mycolicibacterium frederiksbergense TaxID=117567 RepID=A0A6H0RZ16_9MYCO|nr:hypothetical protein [Mycolicibacterium frederiksbergense]MCV7046815.1 hypothetical protein [Mycolicibacterium frederiksbergense]QIV80443.1 hypothetical protein EXE63_05700 [Mycolicibacterium frederiksbergense]